MNKVIAVNIGSRSKKYSYFEDSELKAHAELEGVQEKSFEKFLEGNDINLDGAKIGIRIVAPGKMFSEHRLIDEEYLQRLKEAMGIAPLHIEPVIKEIEEINERLKSDGNAETRMIGVSDSAFHRSIPECAKAYPIPNKFKEEYGIERQGYHGLSISSAVSRLQSELGLVPEKTIVCHLGGGSSVTALRDGLSVDTSMGWTPLEGLPMAERSGSIDPGVIAFISEKMDWSGKELGKFLSTECGLEAISGSDKGDIRELLEAEKSGDQKAALALDVYAYSIKKEIGRMMAILNGCDMLAFTGTIGLRSAPIRKRVVQDLEFFGFTLDLDKNDNVYEPPQIEFLGLNSTERKVAVVPIDEMEEILKAVNNI